MKIDDLDFLDEEDSSGTVFRDVILLALIGFVAMVIIMLPHLSPKKKDAEDHKAPGNVIVEMHWPSEMPHDVDLWVKAPNEVPVGFWNQGAAVFNLLRDDLGAEGDATNENYEVSYSRGIPPGEYVVNAHMYGHLPKGTSIPVKIVVSVKRPLEETRQLLETTIKLVRSNQEVTAFRFRLNDEAELVEGSVSTLKHPLITEAR